MDFSYIVETFVKALAGIPVTLGIMVVSILLSFFPALFLAIGRIYKVKGVTTFSVIYLAFIRSTPAILLILFFSNYFEGKVKESCELQTKYLDLINTLFIEVNPIPVKTALGLMGYSVGPLRMPLFPMEGKNLETLKAQLKANKLI